MRLKPLSFKEVKEILIHNGFRYKSSKGSHIKYENPRAGRTVIVPKHSNKDIPVKTIQNIIKQSGLSKELFYR